MDERYMSEDIQKRLELEEKPRRRRSGGFLRLLLILILVGVCTGAGYYLGRGRTAGTVAPVSADTELDEKSVTDKLNVIESYVDSYYLDEVNDEKLEDGIYKGFMSGLGDRYAEYYTPKEYRQLMDEDVGEYQGIGVSVSKDDSGYVLVESVFEGQPADKAGIFPGDLITSVNGLDTYDMSVTEAVQEIKRSDRKDADLIINRKGEEIKINVVKSSITLHTVDHEMKDGKVGYVHVTEFIENTDEDFDKAVDDLEKKGMKSLIIDLRNNGGGLVDTCVNMASRIIPEGDLVVYTGDKAKNRQDFKSNSEEVVKVPIVILANENTASASEILTGCLKDYGIAKVVGSKTFGKGIVQNVFSLNDGSAIKFTIAKYYTPKGNDIHEKGIEPDVKVEMTNEQYREAQNDEAKDTQLKEALKLLQ